MSGIPEQKQIDPEKSKELMGRLNEIPDPILSVRQFIKENFDALQKSGKKRKALYDFFVSQGLDLGTYKSFQAIYSSVKHDRKKQLEPDRPAKAAQVALAPPKKITEPEITALEKADNTHDAETAKKEKPIPYGLRPVKLADGSEVKIDPETGARVFDVV